MDNDKELRERIGKMVDENSPITIEYKGQDYTKFEGGWNNITRTYKIIQFYMIL